MKSAETYEQHIQVSYTYPVTFTHGIFDPDHALLADTISACGEPGPHRLLVYVDDGVAAAHPQLLQRIHAYVHRRRATLSLVRAPLHVPGGERAKNGWNVVQNIMADIGNAHLDRHSFIVAVGGGSVLDSVGFAASIVHRGIRTVRLPTSVLAQNDAGVGVKTGMDEHGTKNFVGTFAPPYAVLVDFDFLSTLDDKYWRGGVAESFKVALIKDAHFFETLERQAAALRNRDAPVMAEAIKRTAFLHLEHIRTSGDPFEMGTARPLDFGHWSAHRLELLSNYRLGHGQAVAVGIALDCTYAARIGLMTPEEAARARTALLAAGLPVWDDLLEARTDAGHPELLKGLEEFREHLGGELTITLPRGIGHKEEVHAVQPDVLLQAVADLKASQQNRIASAPAGAAQEVRPS